MNFQYRVKVLGNTLDQLLSMGFAVNAHDCQAGEHWVLGSSRIQLERQVESNGLKTISNYETI